MYFVLFFMQKTAYEMRISDWSSNVCSSDLRGRAVVTRATRRSPPPVVSARPRPPAPATRPSSSWEERRVGNECVSTCRGRRSQYHHIKNNKSNSITKQVSLTVVQVYRKETIY